MSLDWGVEWRAAVDDTLPSRLDEFSPDYDPDAAYEDSEDADYDRAVDAAGPPACYSDHDEDVRVKGSCNWCGGTEREDI